jgi:hypothetical protein
MDWTGMDGAAVGGWTWIDVDTHVPAGMEMVTAVIVGEAVNPVVVEGVEVEAGGRPRGPTILVFVLRHERLVSLARAHIQTARKHELGEGKRLPRTLRSVLPTLRSIVSSWSLPTSLSIGSSWSEHRWRPWSRSRRSSVLPAEVSFVRSSAYLMLLSDTSPAR